MPVLHLRDETGETIRVVQLRYLMAGQASREIGAHLRSLARASEAAKQLQKAAQPGSGLEDSAAYIEAVGKLQDMRQGAIGLLLGAVVEGVELAPGDTTTEQGVATYQRLLDAGWSPAEITAVYDYALGFLRDLGLDAAVGGKVNATADFSAPQAD